MRALRSLAFAGLIALLPASASALTITFDNLVDGDVVGTPVPGVTFTNAEVLQAGVSLTEFEFPPLSGDKVAGSLGLAMTVTFATPVQGFGGFFTYSAMLTLEVFDTLNNSLGSVTSNFSSNLAVSGQGGSLPNELLQIIAPGISRATISAGPGVFALDNATITAVPEPSLLLLGLVAAGGVFRRRTAAQ